MKAPIEVVAWQAVTAAGVELPDALEAMYRRTERIDAEYAAVTADVPEVSNAITDMIAGKPVDVAVEDHRASAARREVAAAKRDTAAAAARMSRDLTAGWIGANRELLIVEHLRPVVAEIVNEAAKLVPKLDQFGPAFDGADVAAVSTPAVLSAWRDSRVLAERLRLCINAWSSSWNAATVLPPTGEMVPAHLRIEEPGGIHVWERPEAVADLDVRDGRVTEVLRIAQWHEVGRYRLASGAEVMDYTDRWHTETPWHPGEFAARKVLIPTGKPMPGAAQPAEHQHAGGRWVTML